MVSYLLHSFPGCMHLFASVGQIKVVAPKRVLVWRRPALNGTKNTRNKDKNNGKSQLKWHNKQSTKRICQAGESIQKIQKRKISLKASKVKKKKQKPVEWFHRQKRPKKASSPIKCNNILKDGDEWEKAHRKSKMRQTIQSRHQKRSQKWNSADRIMVQLKNGSQWYVDASMLGCVWAGGLPVLPTATRKWASPTKSRSSGQYQETTEEKDKKRERNKNILYKFSHKMIMLWLIIQATWIHFITWKFFVSTLW